MATTSKIDIIFSPQVNSKVTNVGDIAYLIDKQQLVVRTSSGIQYQGMTMQRVREIMNGPLALLEATVDHIVKNGDGTLFLADDGTYKEVAGGGSGGVTKDELVGYQDIALDISSLFGNLQPMEGAPLEIAIVDPAETELISEINTFFSGIDNGILYSVVGLSGYITAPGMEDPESLPFPALELFGEQGYPELILSAGDFSMLGIGDPGSTSILFGNMSGRAKTEEMLKIYEIIPGLISTVKIGDINTKSEEPSLITGDLLSRYTPTDESFITEFLPFSIMHETTPGNVFEKQPIGEDDYIIRYKGTGVDEFVAFLEDEEGRNLVPGKDYFINGLPFKYQPGTGSEDYYFSSTTVLENRNGGFTTNQNIIEVTVGVDPEDSYISLHGNYDTDEFLKSGLAIYEDALQKNTISINDIYNRLTAGKFISGDILEQLLDDDRMWMSSNPNYQDQKEYELDPVYDVDGRAVYTYDNADPSKPTNKNQVLANIRSLALSGVIIYSQDVIKQNVPLMKINEIPVFATSDDITKGITFHSYPSDGRPSMEIEFLYDGEDRSTWRIFSSVRFTNGIKYTRRKPAKDLQINGDGTLFLANDGNYKELSAIVSDTLENIEETTNIIDTSNFTRDENSGSFKYDGGDLLNIHNAFSNGELVEGGRYLVNGINTKLVYTYVEDNESGTYFTKELHFVDWFTHNAIIIVTRVSSQYGYRTYMITNALGEITHLTIARPENSKTVLGELDLMKSSAEPKLVSADTLNKLVSGRYKKDINYITLVEPNLVVTDPVNPNITMYRGELGETEGRDAIEGLSSNFSDRLSWIDLFSDDRVDFIVGEEYNVNGVNLEFLSSSLSKIGGYEGTSLYTILLFGSKDQEGALDITKDYLVLASNASIKEDEDPEPVFAEVYIKFFSTSGPQTTLSITKEFEYGSIIEQEGDGTKYLADDGTYKEVAGGSGGGDVEDLSDMTNNGFTISEVAGVNTLTAYDKVKKQVVIPGGVLAIGEATDPDPQVGVGVFELEGDNAQYNFIILPDGLQTIGTKAFCNVELGSRLDIPSTVTDINPAAFMGFYMYNNEGLVLPKGLININPAAFMNYDNGGDFNEINDLIIPESVELIGESAFKDASGIRTLYIRCGSRANISDAAFKNLNAEEIVFTSIEAPSFGLDVFDGYMGNIYVPDQALEDYNNIPGNVIPFKAISEREEEGGE